jgi:hypothetical protein
MTSFADAALELVVVDEQVEATVRDVESDAVAVTHERDRALVDGLGGDVADAEAGGAAGEATVGEERDVGAATGTLDRAGDGEHLAHARAALGALVADDDDVAGWIWCRPRRPPWPPLAVEDAGGALEDVGVEAGRPSRRHPSGPASR